MNKRGSLINVPGILGIALILVFCITFFNSKRPQQFFIFDVLWFDYDMLQDSGSVLSGLIPNREFTTIKLTGNNDISKLRESEELLKAIVLQRDTLKGLRFVFDRQAKYWSLVQTLNLCYKEKGIMYVPTQEGIFAYFQPRVERPDTIYICNGL